jgi:4-hydroxy-tetrahydrodipicolinate reductase
VPPEGPLRVGVLGAGGRMGRAVCAAVLDAAVLDAAAAGPERPLVLAAAVDPAHAGEAVEGSGLIVAAGLEALAEAGVEVAVDFTVAAAALANARWCAEHGVHAVVGTTGLAPADQDELRRWFAPGAANCVVAPNFAIGAVLMMRFAELAAPWFETVEIVELHHDTKVDAPSGTALLTARRVSAARGARAPGDGGPGPGGRGPGGPGPGGRGPGGPGPGSQGGEGPGEPGGEGAGAPPARGEEAAPGVRVHAVRLRGLVAHQEVLFGTSGQTLTLRHDSLDRTSFMPGVLAAIRAVPATPGLTVGLEGVLGL